MVTRAAAAGSSGNRKITQNQFTDKAWQVRLTGRGLRHYDV